MDPIYPAGVKSQVIRIHAEARPFKPFFIELSSGTRIRVAHPEDIMMRNGWIVVWRAGLPHIFEASDAVQLYRAAARRAP